MKSVLLMDVDFYVRSIKGNGGIKHSNVLLPSFFKENVKLVTKYPGLCFIR